MHISWKSFPTFTLLIFMHSHTHRLHKFAKSYTIILSQFKSHPHHHNSSECIKWYTEWMWGGTVDTEIMSYECKKVIHRGGSKLHHCAVIYSFYLRDLFISPPPWKWGAGTKFFTLSQEAQKIVFIFFIIQTCTTCFFPRERQWKVACAVDSYKFLALLAAVVINSNKKKLEMTINSENNSGVMSQPFYNVILIGREFWTDAIQFTLYWAFKK